MSKRIIAVVCGVAGVVVCSYLALCFGLAKAHRLEQQYEEDHLY